MSKAGLCISVGYHPKYTHRTEDGSLCWWWCIKEYQAVPRKKDGLYTWRVVKNHEPVLAFTLPPYLVRQAEDYARSIGARFDPDVRQGDPANLTPLEKLSLEIK